MMPRPDCKSMDDPEGQRGRQEQHELLSSRDWRARQPAHDQHHRYALPSLDNDWYPILAGKLKNGAAAPAWPTPTPPTPTSGGDTTDWGGLPGQGLHQRSRTTAMDEIDGRGTFQARELERELKLMHRFELEDQLGISWHKVRDIIRRSDVNGTGEVEYKDFLETVQRYRLNTEQAGALTGVVKAFAYAEEFTCRPPTMCMIVITLVELAFFLYHAFHLSAEHGMDVTWDGPVPYCSVLIYNPSRRYEAWRFVTYMFVHIGIGHFVFNMFMQVCVGVFLEMEQDGWLGSLRVLAVYLAGVLAGSLGTSLSDPDTYIAGASGGVYALIAAHLATMALNWQEDSAVRIRKVIHQPLTRILRCSFILLLTLHDIGFAVYVRFYTDGENRTGFMGHLCGAIAGLLVGVFVLDNRRVRKWEPCVQWTSLAVFAAMAAFAVVWNVIMADYFPKPDYRLYDDESGNCRHYEYF